MPSLNQDKRARYRHPDWPDDFWLEFKASMTRADVEAIAAGEHRVVSVDVETGVVVGDRTSAVLRRTIFERMLCDVSPALGRESAILVNVSAMSDRGRLYASLPLATAQHLAVWLDMLYAPGVVTEQPPVTQRRFPSRLDSLEF